MRLRRCRLGRAPSAHLAPLAVLLLAVAKLGLLGCDAGGQPAEPAASGAPAASVVGAGEVRRFVFDYEVEIPERDPAGEPMLVFLPIAGDSSAQRIVDLQIESPFEGRFETEEVYGNRFWRAQIPAGVPPSTIRLAYTVERRVLRAGDDPGDRERALRFLEANDRVVVDHPVLEPILAEIRKASPGAGRPARARAIYDWVVDNVEYKKVGAGWGNGDTFWACSERYGNCTDFHSLFISLARTEGIPARFEMGFPIPDDRDAGEIGGYHCWVSFWLPETGWFPIDASEAFKHPERRELFYGTHPADRLQLTIGRDLRLGQGHRDRALNYFVYPYVEVGGRRSEEPLRTRFRYREAGDPTSSAG